MKTRRQNLAIRFVAGILALLLAAFLVERCLWRIVAEEERQVEQTLLDVGEQNGAKLRGAMDSRNMILSALCVQMSDEADPRYLIDQFRVLVDIYQVEYIGFADLSGAAYTTAGATVQIAGLPAFGRALAGERVLADVEPDTIRGTGENVNLYLAPVYHYETGEVMGVMFMAYRTEAFSRLLDVGSLLDRGSGCLFQRDGALVAATQGGALAPEGNLFDQLAANSNAESESLARLAEYVAQEHREAPLMLTATVAGQRCYLHILELDSRPGWFLATIVPTEELETRTGPLLSSIRLTMVAVVALLALCVVLYLWSYHVQRKTLHRLAYVDPITGGDNYAAFCRKMTEDKRVGGAGYVISADLRDFDAVNNTCGVQRGNEVIRAMEKVLTGHLEKGELCARVTADRFILFLHADSDEALVDRLKILRDEIAAISAQQDIPQIISKFGARAVRSTQNPEGAYRDVNLALRRLSQRVDYFYAIYNDEDKRQAGETHDMESGFEKALSRHRFEMWYQPKFDPVTARAVAAEALVRWRRADDGKLVPPGKFIPLFEKNGMIAQLDEYTFNAVCAQQRFWLDRGYRTLPISVNLSRVSLMFPDIASRLAAILRGYGLSSEHIELEITESAMEGKASLDQVVEQFRQEGFRIQMDDFGSGYSSLSTLTKRCFDNVKLDKSLVDGIGDSQGDALIESIVRLVHELDMTVTAEGVERESQVAFLKGLGVDNIQGYYYSKPLPSGEFEKLLDR